MKIILLLLLILPLTSAFGQKLPQDAISTYFSEYVDDPDFSVVYVSGKVFGLFKDANLDLNKLDEEEYRGERFKDWTCNVKGNNDMLSISQPQIIQGIYRQYLEEGGSNMIGTNTFSSTTIAMADYEMEPYVYELNYESARLARAVCDEVTAKDPTKPRFVVGAIGPTNRTGSISPSVEDPAARNVTFDELVEAYLEQIVGLVDGGSDILMVEGDNFRYLECKGCVPF